MSDILKNKRKKNDKSIILLTIPFDRVFGDKATWEELVNEMAENS